MTEPPRYPIHEIFDSFQGEGPRCGALARFVRFQFCNLACSWCDTKETWLEKSGRWSWMEEGELKARLLGARDVIFTGGEPLLQPLDRLAVGDARFHVETNGTLIPTEPLESALRDGTKMSRPPLEESAIRRWTWVVSPKMTNSGQPRDDRALSWWAERPWPYFKFIASQPADLDEISDLARLLRLADERIWVALEGRTLASQTRPDLAESIMAKGWNYSPRLQVILWGAEKGR